MKKVSAIITTHHRMNDLKNAVESVINQTYENIELIIVDDASDDGTDAWVNTLNDVRVRYIRIPKEETRGGNYARNKGIKAATGDYIAFLDDDDIWFPEKTKKQVEFLETNPNVGFVYSGQVFSFNNEYSYAAVPDNKYTGDLKELIFTNICGVTSMIMVRRELINSVGAFDEDLRFWQEYELCIRLCQVTYVGCIFEPLITINVIYSDKQRLSNKYVEWLDAVEYIQKKHNNLIRILPEETIDKMNIMIHKDAVNRCHIIHNKKEQNKHLHSIWKITKKPKDFVKYIFNIADNDVVRFKCLFGILKQHI